MTTTRGELKGQILRIVQKDGGYQGFYTDEKLNDAIQDCFDHIAIEMIRAGWGWVTKIEVMDNASGQVAVALKPYMTVIQEVRYKIANRFVPMTYDDATETSQFTVESGVVQWPTRYRIVDGMLYFNPPPAEGGTGFIQVEYQTYPQALVGDTQNLPPEFDRCMVNYVKWRSASQLSASVGKAMPEWARSEGEWKQNMLDIVNKRIKAPIYYREFSGG